MNKLIFSFALLMALLGSTDGTAQVKINGTIKDAKEKLNLAGVVITLEGPSKQFIKKEYVDFDGSFSLTTEVKSGTIVVSLYGYETQSIPFTIRKNSFVDLGVIFLNDNTAIVKDIKVKSSSIDIAKDRKTPVASSTIRGYEMKERIGNKDFVEVTTNLPGVYTSKSGGSFSESRIFIRGYDQNNMALMIDGIPIADVETGNIDWTGLMSINDVVSSVQLQRGLGASKLVNSSVAGTMNLVLRDADFKKGGYVFNTTGNDGFSKFTASLATGRLKNGFSANVLLSKTKGDGYVKATDFEAVSYYIALGLSKGKHDLQAKLFGAPQWHNQRRSSVSIADYQRFGTKGLDPKFNSDWGYLDNVVSNTSTNYGHTPLGILQWDWNFSKDSQLSTKLYGSTGTKGQTYLAGGILGALNEIVTPEGQRDLNFIRDYNSGNQAQFSNSFYKRNQQSNGKYVNSLFDGTNASTAGISLLSEINNNTFYGGLMNFKSNITKNFTANVGLDARSSISNKTKYVNNLYGADGYAFSAASIDNYTAEQFDTKPSYNVFKLKNNGVSVDYNYDAKVKYLGSYGQVEYNVWRINLFAQGGFNRQFIERVDYQPLIAPVQASTGITQIDGYNAKFGVNYNITDKHNIWANAGTVSRPPVFVTVYSGLNNFKNPEFVNEKFESFEFGYGFRSKFFVFNANAYLSNHKNAETPYYTPAEGNFGTTSGINREHKGVELDFSATLFPKFLLRGSFSYGDWIYNSNTEYKSFNTITQAFDRSVLLTDGIKVGGSPERMASIGVAYELFSSFTLGSTLKYADKLYSSAALEKYDPVFYKTNTYTAPILLPSFAVVDAFVSYKLNLNKAKQSLDLRFNMDNILDRLYISESNSSLQTGDFINVNDKAAGTFQSNDAMYRGLANGNNAFFGFGRTWNFNVRYEF